MRALSIRQPFAELILRGEKTIEYRSRPTRIIGERFYIYAAKGPGRWNGAGIQVSRDQGIEGTGDAALPRGVIVGSAVISHCTRDNGLYEWHLADVRRYRQPRRPKRHPQPVWFVPF